VTFGDGGLARELLVNIRAKERTSIERPGLLQNPDRVRRILTIRLGAIGDVLMTLPALASLARAFPHASLTHVVEAGAKDVVEGLPFIAETIAVPRAKISQEARSLSFETLRAVRRRLAAEPFDLVVDFHNLLRSAIYAQAAKSPCKVTKRNWREMAPVFFDERVDCDETLNFVEQQQMLVDAIVGKTQAIGAAAPPIDAASAGAALSALGLSERLAVIAPGSRWPGRALPDRLVKQAVEACRTAALTPLLLGGPDEQEWFLRLRAELSTPTLTEISLKGMAGVIARAQLVVCGDSAPLHYADMLQRPTLAIFGPSAPELYGPMFAPARCLRDPALAGTSKPRLPRNDALYAAIGPAHLAYHIAELTA
jgi:heptosyltransferase I